MTTPPAQNWPAMVPAPYRYQPLGIAKVTVTASAQTLTQLMVTAAGQIIAIPNGVTMVLILAETANVRWCDDGQAPTTTFGLLLTAGQEFQYSGDLAAMQMIAVSGSPVVTLAFYR